MKTVKDIKARQDKYKSISKFRESAPPPPLPENLSQLDTPAMVDMFKLMSVMQTGSTTSWPKIRDLFIKKKMKTPGPEKVGAINAALVSKAKAMNLSQEDIIMNDMNLDTNDIINQINEGTVDVDSGQEELEKMKMVEGDMPGQGKHKQGNWGGGNV
jgi:hypothetical protein